LTTSHEGLFRDNERNNPNEHNRVKNPNWREAGQSAFCKVSRAFTVLYVLIYDDDDDDDDAKIYIFSYENFLLTDKR